VCSCENEIFVWVRFIPEIRELTMHAASHKHSFAANQSRLQQKLNEMANSE
jgi:hypothetical protein